MCRLAQLFTLSGTWPKILALFRHESGARQNFLKWLKIPEIFRNCLKTAWKLKNLWKYTGLISKNQEFPEEISCLNINWVVHSNLHTINSWTGYPLIWMFFIHHLFMSILYVIEGYKCKKWNFMNDFSKKQIFLYFQSPTHNYTVQENH